MNSKIDARIISMEMAIDIVDRFRNTMVLTIPLDIKGLCSIASTIEEHITDGMNKPAVVVSGQPTQVVINNTHPQKYDEEHQDAITYGYMALYKDGNSVWGSEVYSTYDEAEQNACRYAGFIGVTKISI